MTLLPTLRISTCDGTIRTLGQAKEYCNNGLGVIQGFPLHLVDHNISLD